MRLLKSTFHTCMLLILLVSILLTSCGIPQTLQDTESGEEQMDASAQFPAWAIRAAAVELYDALESEEGDPADVIRRITTALDIYQGPDTDQDAILARIEEGFPVLLEDHILAMASAYQTGMLVTLDSFIEALQAWGVAGKAPAGAITTEHFTSGFAGLPELDEYSLGELWPAFILHLGLERAARDDAQVDPLWGDGMLDPLQFTLFSNLIFMTADEGDEVSHWGGQNPFKHMGAISSLIPSYLLTNRDNPGMLVNDMALVESGVEMTTRDWDHIIEKNFNKSIRNKIRDFISQFIGVPLTKLGAMKAAICVSVVLYSHKMSLQSDHMIVYRRWPENPPGSNPYQTELTAHLMFDFVPHNDTSREIVEFACGSPLPDPGPVSDKPLEWSIEDELPNHGNLDTEENITADDGNAHNMYTTLDEEVPRILRKGITKAAAGRVIVKASQIMPDKWRFLEIIVRDVHLVGQGDFYLAVRYYEFPEISLRLNITIRNLDEGAPEFSYTSTFVKHDLTLELNEIGNYYHGSDILYISSFNLEIEGLLKEMCEAGDYPGQYTAEAKHGEIDVHLIIDPSDPDIELYFHAREEPMYEITCHHQNTPPTKWTPLVWEFLTWLLMDDIGAYGIQARGPWQLVTDSDARLIARTHYSEELIYPGQKIQAEVKLEIIQPIP